MPGNGVALTLMSALCSFAQVGIGYEFCAQPTCAGAKPPLASGECMHGEKGADLAVSGPRAGRAESKRRLLPDLQFHGVARYFTAGTAS